VGETGEIRFATDESPGQVADPARPHERKCPDDAAAAHTFRLSLRLDGDGLGELERSARRADRPLPGEDLARRGALLQSGRDVHGISGDERAPFAGTPHDDFARIDADP
jgi:hypothetical protein